MVSQHYIADPLLMEDQAKASIISLVDILCHQKNCFYRHEGTWQTWAQKRSLGQTCGFSGCLKNSCCLQSVVNQTNHKRKRYVLDATLVL